MKTLFTSEVVSTGGRSGSVRSSDGLLNVALGNPLQKGSEKIGPNPETLFAGAYAACYNGALGNAVKRLGFSTEATTVKASVSLNEDGQGGFSLSVVLSAKLPGLTKDQARQVMEAAHKTCPYSKALRGETSVTLNVE